MKNKKLTKKLVLKKCTVADLNVSALGKIFGGGDVRTIQFPGCSDSCLVTRCTCDCPTDIQNTDCCVITEGPKCETIIDCPATTDCW